MAMTEADLRRHGKSPLVDIGGRSSITWDGAGSIVLDDDPVSANSDPFWLTGWSALWVDIFIKSSGSPTNVRILAQGNGDQHWWDFEEGFWASLMWEDVDTSAGVRKRFLLPCGGWNAVRFRAIGTGTGAQDTFTVAITVTPVKPGIPVAHA